MRLTEWLALALVAGATGCQNPGPNRFNPRDPQALPAPAALEATSVTNHLDPALLQPSAELFPAGAGRPVWRSKSSRTRFRGPSSRSGRMGRFIMVCSRGWMSGDGR